jgi:branched-chain amino acid aminotransferase
MWANGRLVPAGAPTVSADDHGLTVGDGVFETAKVVAGRPFALSRHLRRLRHSAAGLALPVDMDAVRAGVDAVLSAARPHPPLARLRVTVTGGPGPLSSERGDGPPTVLVGLHAYQPRSHRITVVTVPWPRNERAATAGLKTISYADNVLALRYAHDHGAHDALLPNIAGNLCEGTGSNVFVGFGDRLLTPPLTAGCLAGITRELLLEWSPDIEERDVPMDELPDATEVFLTSSTRDVLPVQQLDGRPFDPVPGPLTRRAMRVFAARSAESDDP